MTGVSVSPRCEVMGVQPVVTVGLVGGDVAVG